MRTIQPSREAQPSGIRNRTHRRGGVLGHHLAGGARVAGAEVALRVVRGQVGLRRLLLRAEPGTLGAVRAAQDPTVGERVVPAVCVVGRVEGEGHRQEKKGEVVVVVWKKKKKKTGVETAR